MAFTNLPFCNIDGSPLIHAAGPVVALSARNVKCTAGTAVGKLSEAGSRAESLLPLTHWPADRV
jgi:hypothetical protein